MIEHIHRSARIACASVVLLLAACGGGGGGGGAPDPSTAPGITVSPSSLTFTAVRNGSLPANQVVQITISAPNAAFVGLAVPGIPPTWLDYQNQSRLAGSGNNWTYTAAIVNTSLTPGTYTTTIQLGIADAGQNVIAYRNVQISYTVTATPIAASPNSLNFSYVVGGPAPAAQQTSLTGDTNTFIGSANQPWISATPSGVVPGTATISVNPTGLAPNPNPYTGTVTFISGSSLATVSVSLTVSAPDIQSSQASLSFSGVNGATIASQPLAITMNNGAAVNWTVDTPAVTWLVLDRTGGTQADTLGVSVNPANGNLASGVYSSSISLHGSSGGSTFNKTVNVSLTLTKATLTPSPPSVTLGGDNGRDFSGVTLQLSLNTGGNSFLWSYSNTLSTFVHSSVSAGIVSGTPVGLMLTPDATGLSGGTHTGTAKFTATVNGDQVTANVPVTFNQESHKLLVDGNGVGFAKTPTLSKLTQTLKVRDNLSLPTPWTALSDQVWLTVTASGTAGDDLVLTANPTGLTTDTVYLATVTIDSSDTSVENRGSEKVRVGFWVGATDPDPVTTITGLPYSQIVIDPVQPFAYIAVGTDVHIINVHNSSAPPPIFNVAGQVGSMTISHDGSTLYASDVINGKIVPVDLTATPPTVGTPFSASLVGSLEYTRTNGVGVIISGRSGQIFDAKTGTLFTPMFAGNVAVGASIGGTRFCTVDVGISQVDLACPSLDFTSLNGGQLLLDHIGSTVAQGVNASDVAVSADGNTAYVASGASSSGIGVRKYSAQNLSFQGMFTTAGLVNNVEVAVDGRIFGASENVFTNGFPDVWIFDAAGNQLATRELASGSSNDILARQMKVSGDGLRLVVLTQDLSSTPVLIFSTVAP